MNTTKKKVFVGMSGGVDSSVSAYLLKEAGYEVTGVFIKVWQPDSIECTWKEDRLDAMRVASHLDIPFITLNLEKEYKEGVIDYMISEYREGRTPNPDVCCNREVKFGAFWKWAKEQGADYIATGHYAQTDGEKLSTSADKEKDQTYFLWKLTKSDLSHTLFPIGHLVKSEVRKIAESANIPVAKKKDSQGLCFIGTINVKEFLKSYIDEKEGDILDEQGGVIGKHDGVMFYTIGERHGFEIKSHTSKAEPSYIISKDIAKNTITVSHEKPHLATNETFFIDQTSFVNETTFDTTILCEAKGRYRALSTKVQLSKIGGQSYQITKLDGDLFPTSGQSLVLYSKENCLGGGIIR
jgi:tRNA-specific 2-thiouridylase